MKVFAVLLAAGKSDRYGSDKLWADLEGRPLWRASFDLLLRCPSVDAVGIVAQPGNEDAFRALAPQAAFVVPGGSDRRASSRIGVESVPEEFDAVLVHDAARPFLRTELVERVVEGIEKTGAAFPAIPVTDTLKTLVQDRWTTPDRATFVSVQTPQGAMRTTLLRAHQSAVGQFTDEASLIEALGEPVEAIQGDPRNTKVTHAGDLERILVAVETRTGFGYDVHAFSRDPDRPMWLGGVEFEEKPGLDGHSDADALIHAVVDALLGAASLGDIGQIYPNTDPRWKDARSGLFLEETSRLLDQNGWRIVHIDATVLAERPRVMARRLDICAALSRLAGVEPSQVSVKATTNEGLGAIGRGEGIAAMAVATIERKKA